MKFTKYLIASSAVTLSLLMATPALAHSNRSVNASGETDVKSGLHLGSVMRHDKDEDRDDNRDKRNADRQAFLAAIGAVGVGTVTSVDGSIFTLKSRGVSGTTSVTTNASTTYKVNGVTTTSNALSVGSRAIVFGTTDSTGITATLISILDVGRGFFKHLFR